MTELATTQAIVECQLLAIRFWNYTDERNYAAIASLFVDGGVWIRPEGLELRAPDGILDYLAKRSKTITTCHVVSNVDVWVAREGGMAGTSNITAYKHDDGTVRQLPVPLHGTHRILRSHDQYVNTPNGWRVARKQVSHVFDAELS
jgi:hypothetical protein